MSRVSMADVRARTFELLRYLKELKPDIVLVDEIGDSTFSYADYLQKTASYLQSKKQASNLGFPIAPVSQDGRHVLLIENTKSQNIALVRLYGRGELEQLEQELGSYLKAEYHPYYLYSTSAEDPLIFEWDPRFASDLPRLC